MIVKINYDISVKEMYELLTDAFENDAIDYWAETLDYTRDDDGDIIEWKIREWDASDDKPHKHTISIFTIERGLKRVLDTNFQVSSEIKQWILSKEMDVTCYDAIIQAGLFGELVYG